MTSLPATLSDLAESLLTISSGDGDIPVRRRIPLLHVARPAEQQRLSKQCDLWAFVWASSSALADLVTLISEDLGRRGSGVESCFALSNGILACEIGAGSGFASLACALAGWRVTTTDAVGDALALVNLNAQRLGVQAMLRTAAVSWYTGWPVDLDASAFHVLLGADILFLSSNARPVLTLLAAAWSPAPAAAAVSSRTERLALIVDPGRPGADELEALAPDFGIAAVRRDVHDMPTSVAAMKLCTVFVLRPACSAPGVLHAAALAAIEKLDARAGAHATMAYGYTLPAAASPLVLM